MVMITTQTLSDHKIKEKKKNLGVKENELSLSCHWVESLEVALNIRFHEVQDIVH